MTYKIGYRLGAEDVMIFVQADSSEAALTEAASLAPTGTDFRVLAMRGK